MEDLGFMVAMACLAADCRGEYGWIQANPETPFNHRYLANRFNMEYKYFEKLFKRQVEEDRMMETKNGIFIKNMEFYQRVKGAKENKDNGEKPDKMPLTVEEKIERQKQLAADMAYKFPDVAMDAAGRKLNERKRKSSDI
jgi:hypothetical protein